MNAMVPPARRRFAWLPRALRRLEHRLGAQRDDRTLWIWVVPATTVLVTFLVLAFLGLQGKVDFALTVPMALVLSLFLGALSAFYLTAASSDERDAPEAARRPTVTPPRGPSSPDGAVDEKTPVGAGTDR